MVGVILAAGDGIRLKGSSSNTCCKPLQKLNNKTLISYALDNLLRLEIAEAYIVIGKEGNQIKNAIGNEYESINIHYVYQQEQKGLTDALVQALNVVDSDETVILQLSDEIFLNLNVDAIKEATTAEFDFYCGVTVEESIEKIKNNFSVEADDMGRLLKCVEKPETVVNNIKGTGFSIFNGNAQSVIKNVYNATPGKLHDLCDCFNYLTASGYSGSILSVAEREFNINTLSDLTEAESFLNI